MPRIPRISPLNLVAVGLAFRFGSFSEVFTRKLNHEQGIWLPVMLDPVSLGDRNGFQILLSMAPKRILILWGRLTSYMLAPIAALDKQFGGNCEIVVVSPESDYYYPNVLNNYDFVSTQFVDYEDFDPQRYLKFDLVLTSSWNFKKYRISAQKHRNSVVVMGMDNQYLGTMKQRFLLASVIGPVYLRTLFDYVFVAGSRQEKYAKKIGFGGNKIKQGIYAYDNQIYQDLESPLKANQFCFVGRKIPVKGLDDLLTAYEIFRLLCAKNDIPPWELVIAGPGSIPRESPDGVRELDYLPPNESAKLMSGSKCFILPSNYEPFGVVLSEAAASGCLLIATDAVGAADHLVIQNINGFIVPTHSPRELAEAMYSVAQFSDKQVEDGRRESLIRVQEFTPEIWTRKLLTFSKHS